MEKGTLLLQQAHLISHKSAVQTLLQRDEKILENLRKNVYHR